jgi:molybdate transport system ATP-binding protein
VALARALAAEPDVLLLDEPLAGLDVAAATAMRKVLRRVLARDGRSAVLITHDLLDVLTLADRVLVLEAGRIAESGSAATVLATPRSRFGARFAGVNLVGGTADADGVLTTQWGTTWHGKPHGSPRNTVAVTVAELDSRGPVIRVRADEQPDGAPGLAADITAESAAELGLAPGDRVYFSVKAQEVTVHPSS